MEAELTCALAEEEEESQKNISIFRYGDLPEEIQRALEGRAKKTLIPIEERWGEK